MTSVDGPVREFSIVLCPNNWLTSSLIIIALAIVLAAGTWLGLRIYLRWFGTLTEGTVRESYVKISHVSSGEFSSSSRMYSYRLKIQYAGPDEKRRFIKGSRYTSGDDKQLKDSLQVGGKVPVYYSKSFPGIAVYYDPAWHYLVPAASLVAALIIAYGLSGMVYRDLRLMNQVIFSQRMEGQREFFLEAASEGYQAIKRDENDADAYERRGDAEFALEEFNTAVSDYSEALRLRPNRHELFRKRAKAEWLDGHDSNALRDWLKSLF